jgi:hypothetical protein
MSARNTVLDALPHSEASQFLNFRAYASVPAMPGRLNVAQHAVLGRFKKRASPDRDG